MWQLLWIWGDGALLNFLWSGSRTFLRIVVGSEKAFFVFMQTLWGSAGSPQAVFEKFDLVTCVERVD